MRLLLDSSAIIEYVRGNNEVLQVMESADDTHTSALCSFETLAGANKDRETENFIADLGPLPFTFKDSRRAAKIYSSLSKLGRRVNVMDVLIYSQAVERGLAIITKDRDYSIIKSVTKDDLEIFTLNSK